MNRAKKHRSAIGEKIRKEQDPLVAARNKKKLILAAIIADAIEKKDIKKGDLAELLDKYSSEVTRWTSGFHNFTVDTLSDIEEILGVQLLSAYRSEKHRPRLTIDCTLTVNAEGTPANRKVSKEALEQAKTYITIAGGVQPHAVKVNDQFSS